MDTGKIVMLGAVGVGGYLAYQWYYGAGGYADQQTCGASMTAAQLQAFAASIIASAAASGVTPTAYLAAITATTANQQQLACARVAIAQYPTAAAAAATATASASASTNATSAAPVVSTPAATASNTTASTTPTVATLGTLDGIYANLKAWAAGDAFFSGSGDSLSSSVDHWNVYLNQVTGLTIPGGMFANVSGDDPSNLTAAQYWSVMAPWVAAQKGLGGLGVFGGLGALARRYRR
jgi:hypothetical protein